MEIRSFLAFELPEEIRNIVRDSLREMKRSALDTRWTREENIHITLVFMGNLPEESVQKIGKTVEEICGNYTSFNIQLKGIGAFGGRNNARVLWFGLDGDIERMGVFRDHLQKNLESFGIKQEKRKFRPHLTIGRFRKGSKNVKDLDQTLRQYGGISSPLCEIKELVLFKSDLKPEGAVYTRVKVFPLHGKL